jgi:hypothetical protein
MTTIVWDGKELVADSRNTVMVDVLGVRLSVKQMDDTVKIIDGHAFTYKGEPVQAIAVAGDTTINDRLTAMLGRHDELVNDLGITPDLHELTNMETYYGIGYGVLWAGFDSFTLLIITAKHAAIARTLEKGRHAELHTHEDDRSKLAGVGSGIQPISQLLSANAAARVYVSMARELDVYTGGPLTVWDGKHIQTNVDPIDYKDCVKKVAWAGCKNGVKRLFGFK